MCVSKAYTDPASRRSCDLDEAPEVNRTVLGFLLLFFSTLSPCVPHYVHRLTLIKAVKSIKHFCLLKDFTRCVPLRLLILYNPQEFIQWQAQEVTNRWTETPWPWDLFPCHPLSLAAIMGLNILLSKHLLEWSFSCKIIWSMRSVHKCLVAVNIFPGCVYSKSNKPWKLCCWEAAQWLSALGIRTFFVIS